MAQSVVPSGNHRATELELPGGAAANAPSAA